MKGSAGAPTSVGQEEEEEVGGWEGDVAARDENLPFGKLYESRFQQF